MGNWLNIVIILIAIGGPVFGAVWKRLELAREKRKIELEIQRRRDEALRTGQAIQPLTSPVAAPTQAADPAAQHRARLEELRRRQQERLRQAAAGGQVRAAPQSPAPLQRTPAPRPTQRRTPRPTMAPTGQRGSPAAPMPPQRVPTSRRPPTPRPAPPAPRPPSRQQTESQGDRAQALGGLVRALQEEPRASKPRSVIGAGEIGDADERGSSRSAGGGSRAMARAFGSPRPTRADLRRAIVLREVFDAPVALRTDGNAGGPF